jgi:hypothetical protein
MAIFATIVVLLVLVLLFGLRGLLGGILMFAAVVYTVTALVVMLVGG